MNLSNIQQVTLGQASMCPECQVITNVPRCPQCGAGDMLCLARVLNRTSGHRTPYRRGFDASRYPLEYLLQQVPEANVQGGVMDWLRAERIPARVVDAGAKQMRRCTGARGGAGATQAGFADIVGVLPGGRALFIEVKAPQWLAPSAAHPGRTIIERSAGHPSEEQFAFLDAMHAAGACVGIAWSVEDAMRIVRGKL